MSAKFMGRSIGLLSDRGLAEAKRSTEKILSGAFKKWPPNIGLPRAARYVSMALEIEREIWARGLY